MWKSYLARVLVWFVALAGLGLYATAQVNTGNIYGDVTDEQGMGGPRRHRHAHRSRGLRSRRRSNRAASIAS